MGKKVRRKRRASLHGWWKVLPFLLGPMMLFMTFAYWESARIRNQFAKNDRKIMIKQLAIEIKELQVTNHELASIKQMAGQAPDLGLYLRGSKELNGTEELIVVPPIAVERSLAEKSSYSPVQVATASPLRSVLVRIEYEVANNILDTAEESIIHAQESTKQD